MRSTGASDRAEMKRVSTLSLPVVLLSIAIIFSIGCIFSYNNKPSRSHVVNFIRWARFVFRARHICNRLYFLLRSLEFSIEFWMLILLHFFRFFSKLLYRLRSYMNNFATRSLQICSHWEILLKERTLAVLSRKSTLEASAASLTRISSMTMHCPKNRVICEETRNRVFMIEEAASMHALEWIILEERMSHSSERTHERSFYFCKWVHRVSSLLSVALHWRLFSWETCCVLLHGVILRSRSLIVLVLLAYKACCALRPIPPVRQVILQIWEESSSPWSSRRFLCYWKCLRSRIICSWEEISRSGWRDFPFFSECIILASLRVQLSAFCYRLADLVARIIRIRLAFSPGAGTHWTNRKSHKRASSPSSATVELLLIWDCFHCASWTSFRWLFSMKHFLISSWHSFLILQTISYFLEFLHIN